VKFIKSFFLLFPFLFFSNAIGQGGYAGAFLRMGIAARSEALGRAYVAMVEGAESAFFNPASVAMFQRRELNTSFRPLSLDRSFAYIGLGLPIHPKADSSGRALNGGLSVSWVHAGVDNIDARDSDGETYASLSSAENAFNIAFALQPHTRATIGLGLRVVMNRFSGVTQDNGNLSSNSFGFDLGTMIEVMDGVRVGFATRNLNLKYSWNTQEVYERGTTNYDKFPRTVSGGIAISRLASWLTLAAEYEKREFRDGALHLGALANYRNLVQVRLGLMIANPLSAPVTRLAFSAKNPSCTMLSSPIPRVLMVTMYLAGRLFSSF
jgi:hypothetical protein